MAFTIVSFHVTRCKCGISSLRELVSYSAINLLNLYTVFELVALADRLIKNPFAARLRQTSNPSGRGDITTQNYWHFPSLKCSPSNMFLVQKQQLPSSFLE